MGFETRYSPDLIFQHNKNERIVYYNPLALEQYPKAVAIFELQRQCTIALNSKEEALSVTTIDCRTIRRMMSQSLINYRDIGHLVDFYASESTMDAKGEKIRPDYKRAKRMYECSDY